jgi:hypothetical protein
LTSALDGDEWLASCSSRLSAENIAPTVPMHRSMDEPQSWSGRLRKEKNLAPSGIELRPSTQESVAVPA